MILHEVFVFILKEARACVFAVCLFGLMALSNLLVRFGINQYDFIFVGAFLIQVILVLTKQETLQEVKLISVFHVIGLLLELFKTHPSIQSWTYPNLGFFRVGTVPLYSGFMYAAVGSYVIQAWKLLRLKLSHTPPVFLSSFLALVGYANFFTKHFWYDLRWWLIGLIFLVFLRTKVTFQVTNRIRSMRLNVAFILIAFFIWIAENVATALGAWQYPNQATSWQIVHPNKISSWYLLFIVSFLLILSYKNQVLFTNPLSKMTYCLISNFG